MTSSHQHPRLRLDNNRHPLRGLGCVQAKSDACLHQNLNALDLDLNRSRLPANRRAGGVDRAHHERAPRHHMHISFKQRKDVLDQELRVRGL